MSLILLKSSGIFVWIKWISTGLKSEEMCWKIIARTIVVITLNVIWRFLISETRLLLSFSNPWNKAILPFPSNSFRHHGHPNWWIQSNNSLNDQWNSILAVQIAPPWWSQWVESLCGDCHLDQKGIGLINIFITRQVFATSVAAIMTFSKWEETHNQHAAVWVNRIPVLGFGRNFGIWTVSLLLVPTELNPIHPDAPLYVTRWMELWSVRSFWLVWSGNFQIYSSAMTLIRFSEFTFWAKNGKSSSYTIHTESRLFSSSLDIIVPWTQFHISRNFSNVRKFPK